MQSGHQVGIICIEQRIQSEETCIILKENINQIKSCVSSMEVGTHTAISLVQIYFQDHMTFKI